MYWKTVLVKNAYLICRLNARVENRTFLKLAKPSQWSICRSPPYLFKHVRALMAVNPFERAGLPRWANHYRQSLSYKFATAHVSLSRHLLLHIWGFHLAWHPSRYQAKESFISVGLEPANDGAKRRAGMLVSVGLEPANVRRNAIYLLTVRSTPGGNGHETLSQHSHYLLHHIRHGC